jgi:D-alanyl-lipoteichoic acid acyltransferase DltB (MBOAT superfamily)
MLFNSLEYVLFLAIVFLLFWGLVRIRMLRTLLLLLASYVFYMSWNATFIVLIIASTILDYFVGQGLGRAENPRIRKLLVSTSVLGNLSLLGLFKYADFFIAATADTLGLVGLEIEPNYLNLILPVGISFYTFQTLSYTIDVYRRRIPPHSSFLEFATFVAFFPQLVAGPIVRASEFLPQFAKRPTLDLERAREAVFLIVVGLFKKVVIADFLAANLLDRVFGNPKAFSSVEILIALYGYTWQLYGDFSGYTDIARGSAKLFGFELPENFLRPFNTTGIIEFWRRWHITLSRWVQDYIYISLGGSKISVPRTYINLFIAFFLMGLWHGAGWNFVLFGLLHATGLAINRIYRDWRGVKGPPDPGWKRRILVFLNVHFFVLQWPVFRSPSVPKMMDLYQSLFEFQGMPVRVSPWVWVILIGMYVGHFTPAEWMDRIRERLGRLPFPVQVLLLAAVGGLIVYVGRQQAAPFIYFQF